MITTILYQSLAHSYEAMLPLLALFFAIGVGMYFFQEEFYNTYWQKQKLYKSIATLTVLPILATVSYIIIEGHIVWLIAGVVLLLTILTAHYFGLFDNLLNRY